MASKEKDIQPWFEITLFNGYKEIYKASNLHEAELHAHKEAREQKTIVRKIENVSKPNQ